VIEPHTGNTVYNFHAGCLNPFDPTKSDGAPTPYHQWCPVLQSHPQMVGAFGMIPGIVNATIMNDTLTAITERWEWQSAMGTDYPQLALTAMRLHRPALAMQLLLHDPVRCSPPTSNQACLATNMQLHGPSLAMQLLLLTSLHGARF
jgi:hypothetical protein